MLMCITQLNKKKCTQKIQVYFQTLLHLGEQ